MKTFRRGGKERRFPKQLKRIKAELSVHILRYDILRTRLIEVKIEGKILNKLWIGRDQLTRRNKLL